MRWVSRQGSFSPDTKTHRGTRSWTSGDKYREHIIIQQTSPTRGYQICGIIVIGERPTLWPCYYGGGGGGNGGNTGGGGSSGGTTPTTTKIKKQLPKMKKQFGETCVTTVMEFINKYYGGDKKIRQFNKDYDKTYNKDIVNEGLSGKNLNSFIDTHFTTEPFVSFEQAVNSDKLVMVSIVTDLTVMVDYENKTAYVDRKIHTLVVTGYTSDGNLITMDPGTGQERTITKGEVFTDPPSVVNKVITGIK